MIDWSAGKQAIVLIDRQSPLNSLGFAMAGWRPTNAPLSILASQHHVSFSPQSLSAYIYPTLLVAIGQYGTKKFRFCHPRLLYRVFFCN